MKYILIYLAGYITHALLFDQKFRKAVVYVFTFQWVHIGIPTREETRRKFVYHHNPKKTPKGYKRIYPPPHPGGRKKVELEIDAYVKSKMDDGMTREAAWRQGIVVYYPKHLRSDKYYMRYQYNNMKRRIGNYAITPKP